MMASLAIVKDFRCALTIVKDFRCALAIVKDDGLTSPWISTHVEDCGR